MKTVWTITVALATLGAAAAQDTGTTDERIVIKKMLSEAEMLGAQGGFLAAAVKSAPYSGEEITEFTQVLADGTRIHNESRTKVYRDSQGRVCRETPDAITIWDPVEKASYLLNPKDQTYRQLPLAVQFLSTSVSKEGGLNVTVRMGSGAGGASGAMIAAPGDTSIPPPPGSGKVFFLQRMNHTGPSEQKPAESLGRQTMEGLAADGTRQVNTIEAGAIGNDRPIQIVSERWYSPDLQTVMLTRHSDPRTGEEVFRLTNVSREEPPANLFAVPANYQKEK